MSITNKLERLNIEEEKIDSEVESQADNSSAWEDAIEVKQKAITLEITAELAAKARFIAHNQQKPDVKSWLVELLEDVIEREYNTY
ncbi:MAG: hypothetical protein SAJ37_11940 [Oscillatoria sp. PMC 1068.18]|nr:hypothetical protein [Oscillatoria sp. PMC 1076.18]MEC4989452.1 hypothetical protein [Oscillatoria sp. PMC 1068.18]